MPNLPSQKDFEKKKVLFVEGKDEVNVFSSILKDAGINVMEVRAVGGKYQLANEMPSAVKQSSFANVESIGIVQDADDDEAAAFTRICNVLRKCGLPVPPAINEIVTRDSLNVGILVLPGGGKVGYLEDVFLEACNAFPELECVDNFFTCLSTKNTLNVNSKRRAYALLVGLGITENRLGQGFDSGELKAGHAAYNFIREFVNKL